MSIRSIDTIYPYPDGNRFRSRTEAYWAVFFDLMGIEYKYETQGYEIDGTRYLPDFWIPSLKPYPTWVEIKGQSPSLDEVFLCERFAIEIEQGVTLLVGYPWQVSAWYRWYVHTCRGGIRERNWGKQLEYADVAYLDHRKKVTRVHEQSSPFWQRISIGEWWLNRAPPTGENINSNGMSKFLWRRDHRSSYAFRRAVQIARQTRFEHGEQPRRRLTPADVGALLCP